MIKMKPDTKKPSTAKIAVVEDDRDLNNLLASRLVKEGYEVTQLFDGKEAVYSILKDKPDFVLLDWMLPVKSGELVCRDLRSMGFQNSIIMLTAKKQDTNKIDAYDYGASDYIVKPFNMAILLALLENKVRFLSHGPKDLEYRFNDILHYPQVNMIVKSGVREELTVIENLILTLFYNHPNQTLSREEIETNIWGDRVKTNSRSLDMHIMRLRKKIEKNPDWPKIIVTVKGKGILFKPSPVS